MSFYKVLMDNSVRGFRGYVQLEGAIQHEELIQALAASREEWLKTAAGLTAEAARQVLTIYGQGGNWVLALDDIQQGRYLSAALSVLPLVSKGTVKLVLNTKAGQKTLEWSAETFGKFRKTMRSTGQNLDAFVRGTIKEAQTGVRLRSTYQGGPYPAGRFGRDGVLWVEDAAYRSGQVRAERIVHEAGRQAGLDVKSIVDEIVYVPNARAPFFKVKDGRVTIGLNEAAVSGSDESLRLLKAAHELGHAFIDKMGGTDAVFSQYPTARLRDQAEEVFVENFARQSLQGNLSDLAIKNSIQYENYYRQRVGLPALPASP